MDSHNCDVAKPKLKVNEYAAIGIVPSRAAADDVTVYAATHRSGQISG